METVIWYNVLLLLIVLALFMVISKIYKGKLRKKVKLLLIILATILLICAVIAILFVDAILLGMIGPVPN